nr:hypothetical protein [Thiorhodovibrio frisius]
MALIEATGMVVDGIGKESNRAGMNANGTHTLNRVHEHQLAKSLASM